LEIAYFPLNRIDVPSGLSDLFEFMQMVSQAPCQSSSRFFHRAPAVLSQLTLKLPQLPLGKPRMFARHVLHISALPFQIALQAIRA
jgi:hypothetical protein